MNGWTKAVQAILTALAGAALLAIIIVQHNVRQVMQNQTLLFERLISYADRAEDRNIERHNALLDICLTMEERMCDTLCKERRQ